MRAYVIQITAPCKQHGMVHYMLSIVPVAREGTSSVKDTGLIAQRLHTACSLMNFEAKVEADISTDPNSVTLAIDSEGYFVLIDVLMYLLISMAGIMPVGGITKRLRRPDDVLDGLMAALALTVLAFATSSTPLFSPFKHQSAAHTTSM